MQLGIVDNRARMDHTIDGCLIAYRVHEGASEESLDIHVDSLSSEQHTGCAACVLHNEDQAPRKLPNIGTEVSRPTTIPMGTTEAFLCRLVRGWARWFWVPFHFRPSFLPHSLVALEPRFKRRRFALRTSRKCLATRGRARN